MKIERNVQKVDEGDFFYVEPRRSGGFTTGSKKNMARRLSPFLVTAIVVAALTLGIVKYTTPKFFGLEFALKAASGKIALTESQLREVVVGEGLTVYWLGPENGALYSLVTVNTNQNYVRYLPGGAGLSDVGANFRVVGTYVEKNAFTITRAQAKTALGVGSTNSDGNAIYYNSTRPLSVYVGLKSADIQIELFNPIAGQALVDARTSKLLRQIR